MRVFPRLFIGGIGVAAVVWGVGEVRLAGAASDKPTRMTCKELGEKGASGNARVIMTDFILTDDLVYEHKRKSSDKEKWTKIWVPAVPTDSPYAMAISQPGADLSKIPTPRPVSVIVVSSDTKNEEDLATLGAKEELEGMVVNLISSLGRKEKELLESSYGDVSKAQIFEVGRKPTSMLIALLAIAAGAGAALFVLVSFFRRKRPETPAANA
jgi:hypothetical protein